MMIVFAWFVIWISFTWLQTAILRKDSKHMYLLGIEVVLVAIGWQIKMALIGSAFVLFAWAVGTVIGAAG